MKLKGYIKTMALMALFAFTPSMMGEAIQTQAHIELASEGQTVYICTGPKAEKYHKSSKCRGIRKCSCKIVSINLADAKKKGYKPCKICY